MKELDNEKGLTLVEVVASILIFSFALLLLSHFLVRSFEISGQQDNRQVAMNLARQTIEAWKSGNGRIDDSLTFRETAALQSYQNERLDYEDLNLLIEDGHTRFIWAPVTINGRAYDTEVQLSRLEPIDDNPLLHIRVTIRSGGTELARLETLMPNPAFG